MEERFTALQIARAAGVSKRHVLRLVAAIPAVYTDGNGGQRAKAWRISDFPRKLIERLEAEQRRWRYSDIGTLLHQGPRKWTPAVPFGKLRLADQAEANDRCEIIGPILQNYSESESVTSLVQRVQVRLACVASREPVSDRTVRRWLELALKRDRGRSEFDRPELYLPEKATAKERQAPSATKKSLSCVNLEYAVTNFAPEQLQMNGGVGIWKPAIEDLQNMRCQGYTVPEAKRQIVDFLAGECSWLGSGHTAIRRSLDRKWKAFDSAAGDFEVLHDRRKSGMVGRPRTFNLNDEEKNALRNLRLKRNSLNLAIEEFVRAPACRHETREKLLHLLDQAARERREAAWPLSLKRAAHVTDTEKALFRGTKAAHNQAMVNKRGAWWRDEEGRDHKLVAEDIWESDDYSCNAPYYVEDPETADIRLCRQMLCTMDVLTAGWRGADAVGRERDAYRAEDILRHMLRTIDAHGTMPRIWRLERGVWESQVIDGIKLSDGTIWGGLGELFHVEHVFTSRGKGLIESSFNVLQNRVDHRSATIGRNRGEFERAAKEHQRINGTRTPSSIGDARTAGFWSASECADEHLKQMSEMNRLPRKRNMLGGSYAPDDLMVDYPSSQRKLPESERWRFCAAKREATVQGGFVQASIRQYPRPFRFMVNGVEDGVYLPNGFRVLIAFDPAEPAAGCHVFNAERSSKNREGWGFAEKLLVALPEMEIPQVDLSRSGDFTARKRAAAAARTEFRAIVPLGRRSVAVSQIHDGSGNVSRVERGTDENRTEPQGAGRAQSSRKTFDQRRKEEATKRFENAKKRRRVLTPLELLDQPLGPPEPGSEAYEEAKAAAPSEKAFQDWLDGGWKKDDDDDDAGPEEKEPNKGRGKIWLELLEEKKEQ